MPSKFKPVTVRVISLSPGCISGGFSLSTSCADACSSPPPLQAANGRMIAPINRSFCISPFSPSVSYSDLSRTRSEEHTSELQSLMRISYAVFCLKKKKIKHKLIYNNNINYIQYHHINHTLASTSYII